MKILFIYPIPSPELQIRRYQTGLGSLSALLKAHGHQTSLYVPHRYEERAISYNIEKFKPDLVGLSLASNQAELAFQIIGYIYNSYHLPVVIGGVHPTVVPQDCIDKKGVMAICRGEGEEAMLELVTAMERGKDYTKIKNLWFKKDGETIRNPSRPLLDNLDKLPFADRSLFDYQRMLDDYPQVELMAGRGCPYQCSYCVNPFLQQLSEPRKFIRQRSVSNVLAELEEITGTYNHIETLLFQDDTFTLNRPWLEEFSRNYRERFKIPFWCNTRVDVIDREKLKWLKEAGCSQLNVGLESGNDFIRQSVLKRNLTRSQIVESCRLIKEIGIKVAAFNMVGLPYETIDSIRETIDLNKEIGPDAIFCALFYPYQGTELYDLCKEKRWLTERTVSSYFESISVLNQPSIKAEEAAYYYEIFKGLILYPKLERAIRIMARIRIGPGYSLYRLFQGIIWNLTRFISSHLSFSSKSFIKARIRKVRQICR